MSFRWLPFGVALLTCALVTSPASAQRRRGIPVNIESTPEGATVHLGAVDGESLGTTPLRMMRLPRGTQDLYFVLEGHDTHHERIEVRRWRARYTVALERQSRLAVNAANATATGAEVSVDGQAVGVVPHEMVLPNGRHLVQVRREGFVTFQQWITVNRGEGVTLPVLLEREAPRTGSVLVAGDVSGATILVDGEERGATPMVIEGVPEGAHEIVVRAEGLPPWSLRVVVRAGERATANFDLRAGARATVTILTDAEGAIVRVDGEVAGPAPVTLEVSAGEHIVEASVAGRQSVLRTITVEGGARRVFQLELPEEARRPGRLVVRSSTPDATVTVDGEARGTTPLILTDLASGPHAIVVRADGYETLSTTCEVQPGHDCEIDAELNGRATAIVVDAGGVSGAELWVDGERFGPVPFEGTVPSGSRRIEIRAAGFVAHEEQAMLEYAEAPRRFEVVLSAEATGPSEEERVASLAEREAAATGAVSRGAAPLPAGLALIDVSSGWPYVAEARVGVGLADIVDAGFGIRTFGRITEFEARSTIGFQPIELFGIGARIRAGGGIGPDEINTWFLAIDAMASLYFGGHGAVTLWAGLDLHTDQYDFEQLDSSMRIANAGERQDLVRFRIGGALEWAIDRNWGIWGTLEGIAASSGGGRRLYGDIFDLGNSDTDVYGRLGGFYKF